VSYVLKSSELVNVCLWVVIGPLLTSETCRWCGVVDDTVRHVQVYSECHNPGIVQLRVELDFVDANMLHTAPLL
jgi:hypothetical protein